MNTDPHRALKRALLYLARHGYRVIDTYNSGKVCRIRIGDGGTLTSGKHVVTPQRTTMATNVCGCTVVWDV